MGKMQSTNNIDEILYDYISGLEKNIVDAVPDDEGIDYQFSDEFERKMQTMIKRERLKRKYGVPVKTWKRVAAMFVIVLSGILVPTMSVDAVREKVFSYIRNVYETHISTRYFVQEENEEFVPMYPAYLPEGYELVMEDAGAEYLILEYEQKNKDNITIFQQQIQDKMEVHINNEYEYEESCEIRGVEATIGYREDNVTSINWDNGQCRYVIMAMNLSKDEMIKIAESLK